MFKAIARNSCVLLLGLLPSSILDGLGQMLISLSLCVDGPIVGSRLPKLTK